MKQLGFVHEPRQTRNMDWWTPAWIFEKLGLKFDLDPASPKGGVPWIPVARHYDELVNGLIQPWAGRVWLNPPYGDLTASWLRRMHEHRNGIALVFSRTDCKWFHDYVAHADAILFIKGRVKFVDAQQRTKGRGAGSGSMLVAWGAENVLALRLSNIEGFFFEVPTL